MAADFLLESVHIYKLVTNVRLDTAMATDSLSPMDLQSGDQTSVTTSLGPYRLHLDVQKLDDGTFEVFGKGVEQARPMLLGSDKLGPVTNTIHDVLYDNLVVTRYEVGRVFSVSEVEGMVN